MKLVNYWSKLLTCLLFLLGADGGQSGSLGFKQGFSWYPVVIPAWKKNKSCYISNYGGERERERERERAAVLFQYVSKQFSAFKSLGQFGQFWDGQFQL